MHMRRGEWAESVPISGIECVGTVDARHSSDTNNKQLALGTPVAALMGGLGRTVPGSYAQYTVARVENVVPLMEVGEEDPYQEGRSSPPPPPLPWAELAALPESYCTAWTCLFRNLALRRGQRLLIRGASSAFGRAALNLAVEAGALVTATTRSDAKFAGLRALGAVDAVREGPGLPERLLGAGGQKFDAVLELVGNSTVVESLTLVRRDGRLCLAGWLGGLGPIKDFNPLLQMASGVHFSFFGSFVFGEPEFPLSDVPLRTIVRSVAEGKYDAKPFKVFKFGEIQEAHQYMEDGRARGKMVVVVD
jgi:NADPH:quinone reductase-like Zn-dependent oxidoreductase